jgi:hypothetical protein
MGGTLRAQDFKILSTLFLEHILKNKKNMSSVRLSVRLSVRYFSAGIAP